MIEQAKRGDDLAYFDAVFPDNAACYRHLFETRFGQRLECRICRKPAQWRQYGATRRYVSTCCHDHHSTTVGCALERTQVPLRTIFLTLLLLSAFDGKLSATFLARHLGYRKSTIFALLTRLRLHFCALAPYSSGKFSGKVYIDEMLVSKLLPSSDDPRTRIVVFGITDTRDTRMFCIPDRSAKTLAAVVEEHVEPGTRVVCDGFQSYRGLEKLGYDVSRVIHSEGKWKNARGDSSAYIETRWREVRRRIEGVHHTIQARNLWQHLGQLSFFLHCRANGLSPFWSAIARFPPYSPNTTARLRQQIDLATAVDTSGRS